MFVRSRNHPQYLGEPVGRDSSRRAFQFRHRADQLTKAAASRWHTESERRFMLDQARAYLNVADAIAPAPPRLL